MQIEKYTDRLKSLIQAAQSLALRSGHQQLTPLHVLADPFCSTATTFRCRSRIRRPRLKSLSSD